MSGRPAVLIANRGRCDAMRVTFLWDSQKAVAPTVLAMLYAERFLVRMGCDHAGILMMKRLRCCRPHRSNELAATQSQPVNTCSATSEHVLLYVQSSVRSFVVVVVFFLRLCSAPVNFFGRVSSSVNLNASTPLHTTTTAFLSLSFSVKYLMNLYVGGCNRFKHYSIALRYTTLLLSVANVAWSSPPLLEQLPSLISLFSRAHSFSPGICVLCLAYL